MNIKVNILIGLFAVIGCFGLVNSADAIWYSSNYDYKRTITLEADQIATTTSAFPVLATSTEDYLKTTTHSGKIESDDGYDIIFVKNDDATLLDFEIEKYASSTGELVAWIDTAISSTMDTTFYMYYGNSGATDISTTTGVWDDNFVMVQHLQEDPGPGGAGDIKDSTQYINDGTATTSMTTSDQVAGQIDGSLNFDGTDDAIGGSISGVTNCVGSVSTWIYPHTEGEENQGRIFILQPSSGWNVLFFDPSGTNRLKYAITDGSGDTLIRRGTHNDITLNAWNHIVVSYDGTNTASGIKIYVNSSEVTYTTTSGSNTITLSPTSYVIGANDTAGTNVFNGLIDDTKVSNVVRTAGWIETEYNNQVSVGSFLTIGGEETESAEDDPDTFDMWIKDGIMRIKDGILRIKS